MTRAAARRWLVLAVSLAAGCLKPSSLACSDGRICPPGSACDSNNMCVLSGALAACASQAEGAACMVGDAAGKCHLGACRSLSCGDGARNGGEACEGADLGGQTCVGLHYYAEGAGLRCTKDCALDTTGCSGFCGDGVKNGGELCDGLDVGASDCTTVGFHGQTTGLACKADCTFETTGCTGACGDGVKNGGEQCDGSDLGLARCTTIGFHGETTGLACKRDCTFDTSGCTGSCGDGIKNGSEQCDGPDLGGQTCVGLNFYYADEVGLGCRPDCTFDTSGCSGVCGDAQVSGPEACDGAPPDGRSCLDFGFDRGLVGCSSDCRPALADCGELGWKTASPIDKPLTAVWGSAADNVYAVNGTDSTIEHWNGTSWSTINPGVSRQTHFNGVWGAGPDDIYVVGETGSSEDGVVVHWDGRVWTPTSLASPGSKPPHLFTPTAIWGRAPDDVIVVGLNSEIWHWDGSDWRAWNTLWSLPTDGTGFLAASLLGNLYGVWASAPGSGPDAVYVVGPGTIARWNGTRSWWEEPFAYDYSDYYGWRAVWGSSADDVFFVGDEGVIMHWDGTALSPMTSGTTATLDGVWGTGPNDVFAVGDGGTMLHWDGFVWAAVDTGTQQPLRGLWGMRDNLVTVGGNPGSMILRWNRTTWKTATLPALNAIWENGLDDIFVVGDGGAIYRFQGGAWTAMNSNTALALTGVWGSGPNDVYAVGNNGASKGVVCHFDGTQWSVLPDFRSLVGPMTNASLVWGSASDDVYVVVTSGLLHWDGQAWSFTATADRITGLWGSARNDVYATSPSQGVLHCDGASWSVATPSAPCTENTCNQLSGIWGRARNDIYAVGDQGVMHWDGVSWSVMTGGAGSSVAGSSRGDVFVTAGEDLLHLRGGLWERIAPPDVTSINGIWVHPSRVDLVGSTGVIQLARDAVKCTGPEQFCDDGWDNDCDGLQDGADPDCAGKVAEQCANAIDDDGDGKTDCADSECASFPSCQAMTGRRP